MNEPMHGPEGVFYAFAASSHDYIVLYDQQYRHIYMNPAALDLAGLKGGDLLGEPGRESGLFHDLGPVLQEKLRHVLTTTLPCRTELEWNSGEGLKYFDCQLTPVFDAKGRACSVLAVCRERTAAKQVEALELERARTLQHSQRLESLGVLAGNLGHDFNNILAIILGQCEILIDHHNAEIGPTSPVTRIENAALRAMELCRQLQACFDRKAQMQSRINLHMVVADTVKAFQSTLPTRIRAELEGNDQDCEMTADPALIQQAILNLYGNAAEAIGEQKGTITIALTRRTLGEGHADTDFLGKAIQAGAYACLTVADTGSGMEVGARKQLFEPFSTTKFLGRGLGLAAAFAIITAHGGALQFFATPTRGTIHRVFFPLVAVAVMVPPTPAADISPKKNHRTLLLVDDEPPLRIIGSALLKAMGFTVMVVASGQEAIELYGKDSNNIDLILLDLLMPEMGGLETYRLLRQISPLLPIIICCESQNDNLVPDFSHDPFAETVQKPYRPDQLRAMFMKFFKTLD